MITDLPREEHYGYRIDHIDASDRCCTWHNIHCEPGGDLCCQLCPEAGHHTEHHITLKRRCVLDPCDCPSEQAHLDATQPGWRARIGYREPR